LLLPLLLNLHLLLLLLLPLHLPSVFFISSQNCVISTEAAYSLIVSSAAERPPHFAFAVVRFSPRSKQ
jgi:hypothetical protein